MANGVSQAVSDASAEVSSSTWVDHLARYGLLAKGASYAIVGALAAVLAAGAGGKATSRSGALATLSDETGGAVLLGAMAAGFAAYGLWRLVQGLFDREDEGSDLTGLAKRVGYLGRAAIYALLTYTTLRILLGGGSTGSETQEARKTTAQAFDLPAGRWLVGAAGACFIGAGLFNGYRAFTQKFEEKWRTEEMSDAEQRWGARIGSAGLLARLVVFSLIGAFLLKAALEYDSQEAVGLDGALQRVAAASYGPWLLGLVAAGLVCYGIFCFFEARFRRV
jgi:Domain of Unknown Function (DUF1206)